MKITYEMPDKFKKILIGNTYKKNTRYSVTQLLKSPRSIILEQRYGHLIDYDIEDRLWSFFGTAFHEVMESAEDDNSIIEERLRYKNTSGKFDHFDVAEKALYDFKFTSYWSVVYDKDFSDNQKQLSIYAHMLRDVGFEVETIHNILIFRDWKKSEYKHGKHNVPHPYALLTFDVLDNIDGLPIWDWVDKITDGFDNHIDTPDDELPLCSEEFRWASNDTFAVIKNKNKRATKVFDNEEEANKMAERLSGKDSYCVQKRSGDKYKRCEYCSISEYCNQYRNML